MQATSFIVTNGQDYEDLKQNFFATFVVPMQDDNVGNLRKAFGLSEDGQDNLRDLVVDAED
jgi:hypothetical protein